MEKAEINYRATEGKLLNNNKVRTPEGILSYPALFKSKKYEGPNAKPDEPAFWGTDVIFQMDHVSIAVLKKAVANAALAEFGADWQEDVSFPWRPFRKIANKERRDEYREMFGDNCVILKTKLPDNGRYDAPVVVDTAGNRLSSKEIHGGCIAQLILAPRCYSVGSNQGISLDLVAVQKTQEGVNLGGASQTTMAAGDFDYEDGGFDADGFDDAPF